MKTEKLWKMGLPQFHAPVSTTQKGHFFSAPKIASVQHKNASKNVSTHKRRQLNTPVSSTQKTDKDSSIFFGCWTDGCDEVTLFMCWTVGCVELLLFCVQLTFFVLNWRIRGVELTNFGGWKEVVLVLNWCVELRGTVLNWGGLNNNNFFLLFHNHGWAWDGTASPKDFCPWDF